MTALPNYYDVGTVTVLNNSTEVNGQDTIWSPNIRAGDVLWVAGLSCRIESVTDNNQLVLAFPWPGEDGTEVDYEIRVPPPAADVTTGVRSVVQSLRDGLIYAIEQLDVEEGDVLQYTSGVWENTPLAVLAASMAAEIAFATSAPTAPTINFGGTTGLSAASSNGSLVASVAGVQKAAFTASGLALRSSGASYDLTLGYSEVLTAGRTLTLNVGDGNRSLTLGADLSVATNAVTLTGAGGGSSVTLPASGTLGTLAGAETLTNKSIDASANTISNLTLALFAANVVDTDVTLAANSDTRVPTQKAVKTYFDNYVTGLAWKPSVLVATTANITLSGEQTIDGVLTSASRVLVKSQSAGAENGIYVSAAGAWSRAADMSSAGEFPSATVFVESGTVFGDTQWTCTNNSVTVGSTAVVFAQVSGAGTYSAGTGLQLSANQFSIDSTVATLTGSQTLTNKTINGSSNTITNIAISTAVSGLGTGVATLLSGTASGTGGPAGTASPTFTGTVNAADVALTGLLSFANGNIISAKDSGGTLRRLALWSGTDNIYFGDVDNAAVSNLLLAAKGGIYQLVNGLIVGLFNSTGFQGNIGATTPGSGAFTSTLTKNGVDVADISSAQTLTNKVINASNNTLSNITTTMFGTNVVDDDSLLAANSSTRLATQAAVKTYVDSLIQGLAWKRPVACVADTNITLSGEQTIDGVLTSGSRVLVVGQSTGADNGIYVSSAGAWTRAIDANTGDELVWATTLVEGGTVNAGVVYTCNNSAITLGVTSVSFVLAGVSSSTVSAGTGLDLSGSTISIDTNGVTYALFQQVAANSLVGNPTGSTANAQGVTLGANLAFSSGTLKVADAVAFSGGIDSTNIGATTPGTGAFTTLEGTTGTFSDAVVASKSANSAQVLLKAVNVNTGTAAYSGVSVGNANSAERGGMFMLGSAYTASGVNRQDGMLVSSNGAGGLTLNTGANQPIYFAQNASEAGRIDTNKYWLLGYTSSQGAYKLQVSGDAYVSGKVAASNLYSQTGTTAAATVSTWYNTASISGLGYGVFTFWATAYTGASWCSKIFMIENGNGYAKTVVDGAASGMEIQFSGANIQVRNTIYNGYPISWGLTKLG